MKNIYTKLCLSAIGCLMMASCDFLDVVPQGTATVDDIYRTQYQAEGMVLSCYANIPNYFHPQQFPDFTGGNEIITSKGGTTRWFHFRSLVYGEESPTTTYYSLWSNTAKSYPQGAVKKAVWESIRNCYNVLNNLDRVSDITPENLSWWKGEALFLIGYYHQIMLEYYGPIVIIDKEIPMESSPAEMMTSRSPYDTCVDFIANKYSEAARLLPGVWDSSKRNRATSSAALAFKARLLLYAASPLVNGNSEFYSDFKNPDGTFLINQTYDREKWKRAMDAAKEAIDLCEENGYKLYGNSTNDLEQGKKNYHEAFVGDGISGSGFNWNEVLFGFAEQGTISYCIKNMAPRVEFTSYSTKGFRGSLFPTWDCVSRYYTKNGLPWADDPETKKLDPYSIAPGDSTVRFHRNRDPRFYASIGFDRGNYDVQGKTIVLKCRRGEMQQNNGNAKDEYQTDNGYYCQKWVSKYDTYNRTTDQITYNRWCFPYMRLAELYLSYAEADFEYSGTLSTASLSYFNKVRERCGLPTFADSWAKAGGIPSGEKLREILHDERSIELAMEGRRFHDMRRWKIAHTEMMRYQKSWTLSGKTADSFYKLTDMKETGVRNFTAPKNYWLAIPQDQIEVNPNLVQNPGY